MNEQTECNCSLCQTYGRGEFYQGMACVLDMVAKLFQIIIEHENATAFNALVLALDDLCSWARDKMNGEGKITH